MQEKAKNRSAATFIVIGAIVVALLLIGLWSDWFGLMGTEMAPGTTVPPGNPS
ncbi:hypothetical protein [Aureimonas jatrophae]|uniref:Uncharacterized protein n=1 Tax=Aureimonas jatrophae TaxID=1166073 RepID=A0A1H0L739_9HYPH|nr:hypothetical protein [Aureimonas jatrophae]MBB3952438.1 putative membrane protein YkgB [Aureimonas jatrophae]SDO64069.1 hypothetical protein SAMN05192530_10971 [Aureimonas jatrophae]